MKPRRSNLTAELAKRRKARPYASIVGRKQRGDNEQWQRAWDCIDRHVPRAWIDDLIDRSARRLESDLKGGRASYGWSGGKDSLALAVVAEAAGVTDCVLVASRLEFPAFLSWATTWMPDGLHVVDRADIDIDWLNAHPRQLFPNESRHAAVWYEVVQRRGWRQHYDALKLDALVVGRRSADGNQGGRESVDGDGRRYLAPITDWTHEDVLAACKLYGPPLPPFYDWPRGWVVGSGPWPARHWSATKADGWAEVQAIDPDLFSWVRPCVA